MDVREGEKRESGSARERAGTDVAGRRGGGMWKRSVVGASGGGKGWGRVGVGTVGVGMAVEGKGKSRRKEASEMKGDGTLSCA